MARFFHHPDGIITIADFSYPLSQFLIDEPAYSLPPGMIGRDYVQGEYHRLTNGRSQFGGPMPWDDGDRYIANAETYRAAYEARGEPGPEPEPEPTENLTLAQMKQRAKVRIDAVAEKVRGVFLTSAPLQAATYLEKAAEAREFRARGYPMNPFDPNEWSYVNAEMLAAGYPSPRHAADRILVEAKTFSQRKGAGIEYRRRYGKLRVDAATTPELVAAVEAETIEALQQIGRTPF